MRDWRGFEIAGQGLETPAQRRALVENLQALELRSADGALDISYAGTNATIALRHQARFGPWQLDPQGAAGTVRVHPGRFFLRRADGAQEYEPVSFVGDGDEGWAALPLAGSPTYVWAVLNWVYEEGRWLYTDDSVTLEAGADGPPADDVPAIDGEEEEAPTAVTHVLLGQVIQGGDGVWRRADSAGRTGTQDLGSDAPLDPSVREITSGSADGGSTLPVWVQVDVMQDITRVEDAPGGHLVYYDRVRLYLIDPQRFADFLQVTEDSVLIPCCEHPVPYAPDNETGDAIYYALCVPAAGSGGDSTWVDLDSLGP